MNSGNGTITTTITGNISITAPDVSLQNALITGDLLIDESVGNGDVYLNNVIVKGTIRVAGGGLNSIHLKNSIIETITVAKRIGTVRVVAEGSTFVKMVNVETPAILESNAIKGSGFNAVELSTQLPANSKVTLLGSFEQVNVRATSIHVEIPRGSVQQIHALEQSSGVTIHLGSDTKVVKLQADNIVQVTGQGTVEKAVIGNKGTGSTFEKAPVVNEKKLLPTPTPTPTPIPTPEVVKPTRTLDYSASIFTEAAANNGAINNTTPITITLANDTFTGTNGDDFVAAGKVKVSNLPSGLTAMVVKMTSTILSVTIKGNATAHQDLNGTSYLSFTFTDGAFTGGKASTVSNYLRENLVIDFLDQATLSYSGTKFLESTENNGSIHNAPDITITLVNDKFSGNYYDDLVALGKLVVVNLPTGLTAVARRTSETVLTVTLAGRATLHTYANDVNNLTFIFSNSAFTTNAAASVTNYVNSNLIIDFFDTGSILYSGTTFQEAGTNNGTINNTVPITLTLVNDTFTGTNGDDFVAAGKLSVTNLPSGLSTVATRTSTTTISVVLTGAAALHEGNKDISNLTFTFANSAFTNHTTATVVDYMRNNLVVDFRDPALLTYSSAMFTEAAANDGSINNSAPISITLVDGAFTGTDNENFVATGKIIVSNIPSGLTAVATRVSATMVAVTLTGTAAAHTQANDVANLTVTFLNSAFVSNNASLITNYVKNNLGVDFRDLAVTLTYNGSTFNESELNDGSINNNIPITITLVNDTFTGSDGENFVATGRITIANLPAGITALATKTRATMLSVVLTGSAASHAQVNDVSNLTFTFSTSAFTSNSAGSVVNSVKNNLVVDFRDTATLTYSSAAFNEAAANDGTIDNTTPMTITLANDTFTGINNDDFVAAEKITLTNLPAGFTAVVVRTNATVLTVTLTGTAALHANANDISNLTFTFNSTAFTTNAATAVTNHTKNDLIINYN